MDNIMLAFRGENKKDSMMLFTKHSSEIINNRDNTKVEKLVTSFTSSIELFI